MRRLVDDIAFGLGWAWLLRLLDRVDPRPGIGGTSPRITTLTGEEARRVEQILARRETRDRS